MEILRESGKRSAGWLLSRTNRRYSYRNCIFILAHMRCGSTALSNVLCSHPDVSGYGEAHIRYDGQGSLGRLALNQMRRDGWKPRAGYLFDKILHSRHDAAAPRDFFDARVIFLVRGPGESIRSIVDLFTRLGRRAYDTPQKAALYYAERLETLATLWRRFPSERRVGITHGSLLRNPDDTLQYISAQLRLEPALENRYASLAASRRGGGGDPLASGLYSKIEPRLPQQTANDDALDLPAELWARAQCAHERLTDLFESNHSQFFTSYQLKN